MAVYIDNDSAFSFPTEFFDELKKFSKELLSHLHKSKKSLSVILVSREKIKSLNNFYRGINEPTDILSFSPNSKESEIYITNYLGDLIISPKVVYENSNTFNVDFKEELYRCIVHGLLHLMGMDHKDHLNTKEPIFIKQEKILKELLQ